MNSSTTSSGASPNPTAQLLTWTAFHVLAHCLSLAVISGGAELGSQLVLGGTSPWLLLTGFGLIEGAIYGCAQWGALATSSVLHQRVSAKELGPSRAARFIGVTTLSFGVLWIASAALGELLMAESDGPASTATAFAVSLLNGALFGGLLGGAQRRLGAPRLLLAHAWEPRSIVGWSSVMGLAVIAQDLHAFAGASTFHGIVGGAALGLCLWPGRLRR